MFTSLDLMLLAFFVIAKALELTICSSQDYIYDQTEHCSLTYYNSEDEYHYFIEDFNEKLKDASAGQELILKTYQEMLFSQEYITIDLSFFNQSNYQSKFTKIVVKPIYENMFFNFKFTSGNDYSFLNMDLNDENKEDTDFISFVCTDDKPTEVNLTLGSFSTSDRLKIKLGDTIRKDAIVTVKTIQTTKWTNLANIGQLQITEQSDNKFIISKDTNLIVTLKTDSVAISDTDSSLLFKSDVKPNLDIEYDSDSTLESQRMLNLKVEANVQYDKIPAIGFKNFNGFEQTGVINTNPNSKLATFVGLALKIFTFESSILPISFNIASLPPITINRNITFLYDLILAPSGILSIKCDIKDTTAHYVTIQSNFSGSICVSNPNINVIINEYQFESGCKVPSPAFNQDIISQFEVTKLVLNTREDQPEVDVVSYIETYMDDDMLVSKNFAEGKQFILIKEGSFKKIQNNIKYLTGEMSEAAKGIHGFNNVDNCLSIDSKIEDNQQIISLKSSPVSQLMRHISYGCQDRGAVSVTSEDDLNKLNEKGLLPSKHNLLYLYLCDDLTNDFDLSNVDSTALQLTVENPNIENHTTCNLHFSSQQKNVADLTLIYTQFTKAQTLECPTIRFDTVEFTSKDFVLTFVQGSKLTLDSDTIFLMNSQTQFYWLTITSDIAITSNDKTDITIKKDLYSILYPNQTPYELPYTKFDAFELKSNRGETFNINFDSSLLNSNMITIKPFNLTVETDSTVNVEGAAYNVEFSSKIIVDHGMNKLTVVYSRPDQGPHFHSVGPGTVNEVLKYGVAYKLCLYETSNAKCPNDSNGYSTILDFETNMTKLLKENKVISFNIVVADSSSSSPFAFNIDLFDLVIATVEPCLPQDVAYIELTQTKGVVNFYFTSTTFKNTNIKIKDGTSSVNFGELHLEGCTCDASCKNAELKADDLHCDYNDLSSFKNISISDNLVLIGSIPSDEAHKADIYFEIDENANDLTAEINGIEQLSVEINPATLKLGAITFHIFRSRNYDALFSLIDDAGGNGINIDITCDKNINISQMPKFTIDGEKAKSGKVNIAFTGEWEDKYNEDVVQVINIPSVSLKVSDIVPFRAEVSKNIEIISTTKESGVTGPIEFTKLDKSQQPIAISVSSTYVDDRTTIHIMNGINIPKVSKEYSPTLISVAKSTITLLVDAIRCEDETAIGVPMPISLTLDENGVSSVEVNSVSSNINSDQSITLINNIPTNYDETNLKILTDTWPLLGLPVDVMQRTNLDYSYLLSNNFPHGFNERADVMETKIEGIGSLKHFELMKKQLPSSLPYVFEYGKQTNDGEFLITNINQFKDISAYLPMKIDSIVFDLHQKQEKQVPIDIVNFQDKTMSVTINIARFSDLFVNMPTKKINLTINGGEVKQVSPNSEINIDVLTLTMCDFAKNTFLLADSSVNMIVSDADSLNCLVRNEVIKSISNPINVTANTIQFEANGWSIIGNTSDIIMAANSFTNINFIAYDRITLFATAGVTSIQPITVITEGDKEYEIGLSGGLASVADTMGWKIDTKELTVKVVTPFYPLPDIFSQNKNNFRIILNKPADDPAPLNIYIKKGTVYHESRSFDVSELPESSRFVTAGKITFEGQATKLDFTTNDGQLRITDASVVNQTNAVLGNTKISGKLELDHMAVLSGKISFTKDSEIIMNWKSSATPLITITSQELQEAPKSITLIFNEEITDNSDFNDKYYKWNYEVLTGKFDCNAYKAAIKFKSTNKFFDDSTNDNIMEKMCVGTGNQMKLYIKPNKLLPVPTPAPTEDQDSGSKDNRPNISTGAISGITIAAVVVVAIVVGVVVYTCTRNKYEALLSTVPMEDGKPAAYIEDL